MFSTVINISTGIMTYCNFCESFYALVSDPRYRENPLLVLHSHIWNQKVALKIIPITTIQCYASNKAVHLQIISKAPSSKLREQHLCLKYAAGCFSGYYRSI